MYMYHGYQIKKSGAQNTGLFDYSTSRCFITWMNARNIMCGLCIQNIICVCECAEYIQPEHCASVML